MFHRCFLALPECTPFFFGRLHGLHGQLLIASLRRQRLGELQHASAVGKGVRRALGAAVERLAVDLYAARTWEKGEKIGG